MVVMAKSPKARLIKECKDKGLNIPAKATIEDLKSLLATIRSGKGYHVRLIKPTSRFSKEHPVHSLNMDEEYFLPPSEWADEIVATKIVRIVNRCLQSKCPKGVRVLEVPRGYHGSQ